MLTTTTTTTSVKPAAGSNVVIQFPYKFLETEDLDVYRVAADGTRTSLTEGVDYSVTGAGDDGGGSLTITTVTAGDTIIVSRTLVITQTQDYVENDGFPSDGHERQLDKLTMIAQQHDDSLNRSVKVKEGEVQPAVSDRKGRQNTITAWDASGDYTEYTPEQLWDILPVPSGTVDNSKVTQTFADKPARDAATPAFTGQLGGQLDTDDIFISTGITPGDWVSNRQKTFADKTARDAEAPLFNGQLGVSIDSGARFRSYGTSAGEWEFIECNPRTEAELDAAITDADVDKVHITNAIATTTEKNLTNMWMEMSGGGELQPAKNIDVISTTGKTTLDRVRIIGQNTAVFADRTHAAVRVSGSSCTDVTIRDCYIENCGRNDSGGDCPINIRSATTTGFEPFYRIKITGNTIRKSQNHVLLLWNVNDSVISNNVVDDVFEDGTNSFHGNVIRAEGGSNNVVADNTMRDIARMGIEWISEDISNPFTVDTGTNVITNTGGAHGLSDGDAIYFAADKPFPRSWPPNPIVPGKRYYIINATSNTFKISETSGGSEVNITTTGGGGATGWAAEDDMVRGLTISGNTIEDWATHSAGTRFAISVGDWGQNIAITGNTIRNAASGSGDGIEVAQAAFAVTVSGNSIYNVGAVAISCSVYFNGVNIIGNTIIGCTGPIVMNIQNGENGVIANNIITDHSFDPTDPVNNKLGIRMKDCYGYVVTGNIIEGHYIIAPGDDSPIGLDPEGMTFGVTPDHTTESFNRSSHGLVDDDRIHIWSSAADPPNGLDTTVSYYVLKTDDNNFQVSLTPAPGAAVAFSDNGTDVRYIRQGLFSVVVKDNIFRNAEEQDESRYNTALPDSTYWVTNGDSANTIYPDNDNYGTI